MTETEQILKELRNNRAASATEHSALKELVSEQGLKLNTVVEDLRGNGDRGMDGLIKTVKKHSRMLRPFELIEQYPKASIILGFVIFHLIVYTSFKGMDKLLTFF